MVISVISLDNSIANCKANKITKERNRCRGLWVQPPWCTGGSGHNPSGWREVQGVRWARGEVIFVSSAVVMFAPLFTKKHEHIRRRINM